MYYCGPDFPAARQAIKETLYATGIDLIVLDEGLDTRTASRKEVEDYFEAKRCEMHAEIMFAWRRKQGAGFRLTSSVPFGYIRRNGESNMIKDEEVAPYLSEAFSRYASGQKMRDIAKWLNEQGVEPPMRHKKRILGKPYEMSLLPENLMHTAMDNYWTIWTFLIGHELYHAIHPEDRNGKDTELRADQYAYRLLINLIMQQKKNEVPEELQVFWEDQYLSPIILFEMFRLFDVYSELKGKKIVYQDYPTPKERQDNIFSMFKDDIPEEMNTEEGNKVLNLILNSSEYAEDWLRYKISKGKL